MVKSVYVTDNGSVKGASAPLTELVNNLIPTANLGTGIGITTKYLRGDQTWQAVSGGSGTLVETHVPLISIAEAMLI